MIAFLELFSTVVAFFAAIIMLMMTTRAILSLLYDEGDIENKLYNVMVNVTEVAIAPVRYIFHRLDWFQNTPIDMAFLVAYLILSLITMIFI